MYKPRTSSPVHSGPSSICVRTFAWRRPVQSFSSLPATASGMVRCTLCFGRALNFRNTMFSSARTNGWISTNADVFCEAGRNSGIAVVQERLQAGAGDAGTLVRCAAAQALQQRPREHAVYLAVGHRVLERALGLRRDRDERRPGHTRAEPWAQRDVADRDGLLVVHAAVHPEHEVAKTLRLVETSLQPGMCVDVRRALLGRLRGEQRALLQRRARSRARTEYRYSRPPDTSRVRSSIQFQRRVRSSPRAGCGSMAGSHGKVGPSGSA